WNQSAILECMRCSSWNNHVAPLRRITPIFVEAHAQSSRDDVERVILMVLRQMRSTGAGPEPPLRHGVASCRFVDVGFENRADLPHRILTTFPGPNDNGLTDRFSVLQEQPPSL